MTLDELDKTLPNGFHDAEVAAVELDYVGRTAKFRMSLLVGSPDDPVPERDARQRAVLSVTGLYFCAIEPPDPNYPFASGKSVVVSGDPAEPDHLPSLPALMGKLPAGTWCYRFFVVDWNSFMHIAARDAEVTFTGPRETPRR